MTEFIPAKLHVKYLGSASEEGPIVPRVYTLTHSDASGDLFLTIGNEINFPQIEGFYTRLMRDEVIADWDLSMPASLHVFCHVSGGLVFGSARFRDRIFRYHLPMVLQAFYYGDRRFLENHLEMSNGQVVVHFIARQNKYNRDEIWGALNDYAIRQQMKARRDEV
jgi:hypothetical protein